MFDVGVERDVHEEDGKVLIVVREEVIKQAGGGLWLCLRHAWKALIHATLRYSNGTVPSPISTHHPLHSLL